MASHNKALNNNYDVDYTIVYRFTDSSVLCLILKLYWTPLTHATRQSSRYQRARKAFESSRKSWALHRGPEWREMLAPYLRKDSH